MEQTKRRIASNSTGLGTGDGSRWLRFLSAKLRTMRHRTWLAAFALSCSPAHPPISAGLPPRADAGVEADAGAVGLDVDAADADAPEVITLCEPVLCGDVALISVALPIPARELANARVHVSFGPERLETKRPRPIDSETSDGYQWKPPMLSLRQRVASLSPSLSQLELSITIPPELAVDGVQYSLKIDTPQRGQVLNVRRVMRVTEAPSQNPAACGEPCKAVSIRLYSGSQSGITCDSNLCDSGLEFHLEAPRMVQEMDGVEVCRNQLCARGNLTDIDILRSSAPGLVRRGFELPLYWSRLDFDAGSSQLLFKVLSDPVILADGDRYKITFYKGTQVIGRFEKSVRYDESYPNGKACDKVPCRRAVVHARL